MHISVLGQAVADSGGGGWGRASTPPAYSRERRVGKGQRGKWRDHHSPLHQFLDPPLQTGTTILVMSHKLISNTCVFCHISFCGAEIPWCVLIAAQYLTGNCQCKLQRHISNALRGTDSAIW